MATEIYSVSQGIVRKPKAGNRFPENSTFKSVSQGVVQPKRTQVHRRRII